MKSALQLGLQEEIYRRKFLYNLKGVSLNVIEPHEYAALIAKTRFCIYVTFA
jgi:hypothetical protein